MSLLMMEELLIDRAVSKCRSTRNSVVTVSCRIASGDAVPEMACCRLAPFHQVAGGSRARGYPSDTTDAQWALIDTLLPDPAWLAGQLDGLRDRVQMAEGAQRHRRRRSSIPSR